MMQSKSESGQQTNTCWCGCGTAIGKGSCFAPGHDRKAEAAIIALKYGSLANMLQKLGYGPGGMNLMEAAKALESAKRP